MQAPTAGELLPVLGLRATGLPAACALPLLLTATLFAGPLAMLALDAHNNNSGSSSSSSKDSSSNCGTRQLLSLVEGWRWAVLQARRLLSVQQPATSTPAGAALDIPGKQPTVGSSCHGRSSPSPAGGGGSSSVLRRLQENPLPLRNYVAAPATEELCFRAGLVSCLLLGGAGPAACIWLSPLAFGAAHLHHWHELVAHQGWPRQRAAAAVAFQVGGWVGGWVGGGVGGVEARQAGDGQGLLRALV